jgi:p24 family protein delta-1
LLCADAITAKDTKIKLDWRTGVAATNWDDVAKKENLDLMATELRKLEDSVKEIHSEMMYLRRREEQMRNLNGAPLLHVLSRLSC